MAFTIVDTDILIDAVRHDSQAIACLQRYEQQSALAISAVTQMELVVGCRNKVEMQKLDLFPRSLSDPESQRTHIGPGNESPPAVSAESWSFDCRRF